MHCILTSFNRYHSNILRHSASQFFYEYLHFFTHTCIFRDFYATNVLDRRPSSRMHHHMLEIDST